uniref:Uncharacterized protein n=1 Tax=Ascaris lumbricoides TaxID=6252 RepID=A0A0M3IAN0_ASCLU
MYVIKKKTFVSSIFMCSMGLYIKWRKFPTAVLKTRSTVDDGVLSHLIGDIVRILNLSQQL